MNGTLSFSKMLNHLTYIPPACRFLRDSAGLFLDFRFILVNADGRLHRQHSRG